MAKKRFDGIEQNHREFIEAQHMFFVATAAPTGRVNMAPKGQDTLRVMTPNRIVWLNLTGSENETAAHLRETPRMTLMWCSFERNPLILRVYGDASIVHPRDITWGELARLFPELPGARQIIDLRVDMVLTSCGFGVPLYDFIAQRETLAKWAGSKGVEGVRAYWAERNVESLDGKPTGILENYP
jgi:predicted pyridoxine 5'-phosphate oxidase superfamily flavin-nucleotide-binding protein